MNASPEKWHEKLMASLEGRNPVQEDDLLDPPEEILRLQEQDVSSRKKILASIQDLESPASCNFLAYMSQWDEDWEIRKDCISKIGKLFRLGKINGDLFFIIFEASASCDAHGAVRRSAIEIIQAYLTTTEPSADRQAIRKRGSVRTRDGLAPGRPDSELGRRFISALNRILLSAPDSKLRTLARRM